LNRQRSAPPWENRQNDELIQKTDQKISYEKWLKYKKKVATFLEIWKVSSVSCNVLLENSPFIHKRRHCQRKTCKIIYSLEFVYIVPHLLWHGVVVFEMIDCKLFNFRLHIVLLYGDVTREGQQNIGLYCCL
jgi:hypothetical protein